MDSFKCEFCENSFTEKRSLTQHVRSAHLNVTFPCEICQKTFTRKSSRQQHQIVCQGRQQRAPEAPSHTCDICGKTFSLATNANQHRRAVHEKVKFDCGKCDKSFVRNAEKARHESSCTGPVTYSCDVCGNSMRTLRELQFHQKMKHKKEYSHARPNISKAPVSGSSTDVPKRGLKRRLNSTRASDRSGPSSYGCRRCTAKFPNRKDLHAHNVQRHYQVGAGLHPEPFDEGAEPWVTADGGVDDGDDGLLPD